MQSLVERIAPRLKELQVGGYSRTYRRGGRLYRSGLQATIAEILTALGVPFQERVKVHGSSLRADFLVNDVYVFVDRRLPPTTTQKLARRGRKVLLIQESRTRSDRFDYGVRILQVGRESGGRLQTIFLDDPSFNFDYAHILPQTEKCSVMHGHTSSALVEITGTQVDGMVVDFGRAKEVIREAIRSLDHKLFINRRYVAAEGRDAVKLRFRTVHGPFEITAPRATTVLLQGEATVENLANEVLERITPKMPDNVSSVGVYVYEGLNKGSHLLAQLHQTGARKPRRKP